VIREPPLLVPGVNLRAIEVRVLLKSSIARDGASGGFTAIKTMPIVYGPTPSKFSAATLNLKFLPSFPGAIALEYVRDTSLSMGALSI